MKTIYDTNWFLKRIKETHKDDYQDYQLKSKYKNNQTKVVFHHLPCDNDVTVTPASFLSGRGCPICGHKHAARAQQKTLEQAQKDLPSYIHIIGDYKGALKEVTVHCDRCNETYKTIYHNFSKHNYCTHCGKYARETTERFSKEVTDMTNGEYSLVSEYTKANDYVKIKHEACGNIYKVTPHNFKHGKRCPNCNSSHGETYIVNYLEKEHLKYEYPKLFSDLKHKDYLHYDFFIPSLNVLIEYQGEQHYHPVEHFGGKEKFKDQVLHDNIKRRYALKNGYQLIEVPYTVSTQSSVEVFIDGFIKQILGN